jgi:hypothetical protein
MKIKTYLHAFAKLRCSLFGHNYKLTKKVTAHVKEYTCSCCQHQLTTDSNGRLTELTPKFEEINCSLERLYKNRLRRVKKELLKSAAVY